MEVITVEGAWIIPAMENGFTETLFANASFVKFKTTSASFLAGEKTREDGTVV